MFLQFVCTSYKITRQYYTPIRHEHETNFYSALLCIFVSFVKPYTYIIIWVDLMFELPTYY